jgi:type IV pilus assembly protein PilV
MSTSRRQGTFAITARRAQSGVGLLEVLISLLVLSFGMLGLAGLQLWSLRNNQSSMQRSLAVVQTYTIIDAMRADRATALAGGFNDGAAAPSPFASNALSTWRAGLIDTLGPEAEGSVSCQNDECTIIVRWNDQRAAAASDGHLGQQAAMVEITTQVRL